MKLILIVDDSRLARKTLREMIESAAYRVEEAKDGDEAVELYARSHPDLVLLDLLMEKTGGMEALQKLRELDPQAKVVIASADIQIATQTKARLAGAVGYIAKPFNRQKVLERIARALSGSDPIGLSEWHHDTLAELINIGYGRAAGALSEMTGKRVLLETPRVEVFPLDEVGPMLSGLFAGEVASVHQVFTGPVSGSALLLMGQESAPVFRSLIRNEASDETTWDETAREALKEVGNVLLNACMGVLSNLAQVQVSFALPRLHIESVSTILRSISIRDETLKCAVVVQTRFRLRDTNVSGYLVIILGMPSYNRLVRGLEELKNWEQVQVVRSEHEEDPHRG